MPRRRKVVEQTSEPIVPSSNKELFVTVFLALTAIVLAILLFKQGSFSKILPSSIKQPPAPEQQPTLPPSAGSVTVTQKSSTQTNLSDIKFPSPTASEEERQKFTDKIIGLSEKTNKITIKDCMASPKIAQVVFQKPLIIENQDKEDRLVNITPDIKHTVKGNSNLEVTADFGKGLGIYGFVCDNNQNLAGIIFVTEQAQ